jgi:hypothetical protein
MKTRILAAALIAALSQTAFADNGAYWNNVDAGMANMLETKQSAPLPTGDYWAAVQAGFDNMLDHTPYAGETAVTVARGEPDPVETLLHAMVRSEDGAVRVRGIDTRDDNVAAAFGRMLNHTPHDGETAVTVARQLDYRVDRLVMAMRNARPAAIEVAAK